MNKNIRIILVHPSHPGNIGAVARAMKTMGFEQLYLVNPKHFPSVDATARAAGADDILAKATIIPTLADALKDVNVVFGTSVRSRAISLPKLNLKDAAKTIVQEAQTHNVAIVFGRENNGLTNEEIELCNHHLYIPTNPDFYSLNLAAAVQLVVYEIQMTLTSTPTEKNSEEELASNEEIQLFYNHLQQVLNETKFLDLNNSKRIMSRLKNLFNRTRLEKNEVNILRGVLSSIESKIK